MRLKRGLKMHRVLHVLIARFSGSQSLNNASTHLTSAAAVVPRASAAAAYGVGFLLGPR
jgi:hypothetical protein